MLKIFYTDYYLPEEYVTIKQIMEVQENFILPKGFSDLQAYADSRMDETKQERISTGLKENGIDICDKLFSEFMENTNIPKNKIKSIVCTDPMPFNTIVKNNISIPHYLIGKYKLDNASMGIIQQQCTGTILSLSLMEGILEEDEYGVILSSNYAPELKIRNMNFTFMGDGAAIMVVSKNRGAFQVIDQCINTEGFNTVRKYEGEEVEVTSRLDIIKKGVKLIEKVVDRNYLTVNNIAQFIPQNVNEFIYSNFYARMLGIPKDKIFYDNISYGGHVGDVDLIRNLCDYMRNYDIDNNSNIILYGLGSNGLDISYGVVLLLYNENQK